MPSLTCKALGLIFLLSLIHAIAPAQTMDWFKKTRVNYTAAFGADTAKLLKRTKKHMARPDTAHKPLLAVKRSAIIPGWGQLYNQAWWKTPVIYTTLGLFGQLVVVNQRSYKQYLEVYKLIKDQKRPRPPVGDPIRTLYDKNSQTDLNYIDAIQSNYQRNMQLSILGFVGFWGVQVIDAYIDAKFIHSYSIDSNLSFHVTPGITTTGTYMAGNVPQVMPVMKLVMII